MGTKGVIPVELRKVRDPNGKETLKATVPVNLMFEKGFDAKRLEDELSKFERRYFYLITCLKSLLGSIRSKTDRDKRVFLYWEFGNKLVNFIEENGDSPLSMGTFTQSLARDLGVSDKIITRCKRFRLRYPDVTQIDPNRSFDSYVKGFEGGYASPNKLSKREKDLQTVRSSGTP